MTCAPKWIFLYFSHFQKQPFCKLHLHNSSKWSIQFSFHLGQFGAPIKVATVHMPPLPLPIATPLPLPEYFSLLLLRSICDQVITDVHCSVLPNLFIYITYYKLYTTYYERIGQTSFSSTRFDLPLLARSRWCYTRRSSGRVCCVIAVTVRRILEDKKKLSKVKMWLKSKCKIDWKLWHIWSTKLVK